MHDTMMNDSIAVVPLKLLNQLLRLCVRSLLQVYAKRQRVSEELSAG
jgi:hypothetical protein